MDTFEAKAFLNLIAAEEQRRRSLLPEDDGNGLAYDQWMFTDLPFLHDLCFLYLVAVRHHVERRLLFFAACATEHGKPITLREYWAEQDAVKTKGWREIKRRLHPERCARY